MATRGDQGNNPPIPGSIPTLVNYEVVVNLIANTTTQTGLHVGADIDLNLYPTGRKVSDDESPQVNLFQADFHGEDWNYIIKPNSKKR